MELFQEPLTAIHPGNLSDTLIDKYVRIAKSFAMTGWFGLQGDMNQRTAQAFAKLMTGAELGLGPMASMRCIHALSDGKIELHAILVAALIRRSPKYDYKVLTRNNQECKVEFFNTEGEEPISLGISHWDLDRAKQAELGKSRNGKKTNWQKHAQSMLFARCMTDGERTYCPDVVMVGPLYGIGEIDTQETEAPDIMEVAQKLARGEVAALPEAVEPVQTTIVEETPPLAKVHQMPHPHKGRGVSCLSQRRTYSKCTGHVRGYEGVCSNENIRGQACGIREEAVLAVHGAQDAEGNAGDGY